MSTPQLEDTQETIFKLREKLRVSKEREEWMRQDSTRDVHYETAYGRTVALSFAIRCF